jgi:hypothetical protein
MYTDTREDQASTFPNAYGDIHYAARRVAAVKGTDTFFTMNAEWTMDNKTQYVNTTEYDFTGLKLFEPTDTNKNVMHRFGFLMQTPIYKTTAALVYWNFRFSGVNVFTHAKLLVQATGIKVKGSPNLCDALGPAACNLKCGRSTCQVRIALAGSTRFVFAILGVTTGANANTAAGDISMEYKPPSSCWTRPAAYEVFDVKPTNVFEWDSVSAGRMPDLDCEDAKKASLLSLEYVAKPFCQAPEAFPGGRGLQSCVPAKPLCKEDVVNAVDSAIGAGIKTAAYEWSGVKVGRCR